MKKCVSILLIMLLILSGCSKESTTTNAALDGDLELKENQTLLVGQITTINGNEITLALAKEVDMSNMPGRGSSNTNTDPNATQNPNATQDPNATQNPDATGSAQGGGQMPSGDSAGSAQGGGQMPSGDSAGSAQGGGQMPSGDSAGSAQGGGQMPSGDSAGSAQGGGQMPSGDSAGSAQGGGQMPSGDSAGGFPGGGQMPGGKDTSDSSSSSDSTDSKTSDKQQSKVMYTLTGEEQSMTIPVGTPVTTLLGTVSTFSRIAAENYVKIITETDDQGNQVIVAVYIVG